MTPTIVLVHGAFADSSSWNGLIDPLQADGHRVVAWSNPLRGVAHDAAELTDLLRSTDGPVLLAAHSYGGAVTTNVAADSAQIVGLVYVAGFALQPGESCADASSLTPGSTLAETLRPVALSAGGADLYIAQERFHQQFAADLPEDEARRMAVTQRPITDAALGEASGPRSLWQEVPSWFVWGELDRNIPAGAQRLMAERAGARQAVEVPRASHVVGISRPEETLGVLRGALSAATATAA